MTNSEIKIFKAKDGKTEIQVKLDNEQSGLNHTSLKIYFKQTDTSIKRHISNIYKSQELKEESTCAFFAQVQKEGGREVTRKIKYYNLNFDYLSRL